MAQRFVTVGSRGSALALWQTHFVADRLATAWPGLTCRVETIRSRGDRDQTTPLPALGGKGLFTAELEEGLRSRQMDFAVHSLKDLPIEDPAGLVTGAILARSEGRDALVNRTGAPLDELPPNAVVGTSSTRRRAQILARRPDLLVRSIRGNVDTRLRKLDAGDYDAIVLAGAGLVRMGLDDRVAQWLPLDWFTPAPGQGALAVQCRADDGQMRAWLAAIHEPELATLVQTERRFLAELGGGCAEPVGAWASWRAAEPGSESGAASIVPTQRESGRSLRLQAWYSTPDGQTAWSGVVEARSGEEAAQRAAHMAQASVARVDSHSNMFGFQTSTPRVVLTRSISEGLEDCRKLLAVGMQPILAPVVEMETQLSGKDLVTRIGELTPTDWFIFTSANAVRIFHALWQEGGGEHRAVNTCRVAVVGPHTAAAASEAGLPVSLTPDIYSGDGLAGLAHHFAHARVIIPRSAIGRSDWHAAIAAHADEVVDISLYQPQARPLEEKAIAAMLDGIYALTFASGSAVRAFRSEIDGNPALAHAVSGAMIACIGPQTAQVAQKHGFHVSVVSETYTMPALIQTLANLITER